MGDSQTAPGLQQFHMWLLMPECQIPAFHRPWQWLRSAATSCLSPARATGGRGRTYWLGSEAGLLGLHNGSVTPLASHGSAGETDLGAGFTITRKRGGVTDWHARVEGGEEQTTSFWPEAAGLSAGIETAASDESDTMLVDNESLVTVVLAWAGSSHHPSPLATADSDLGVALATSISIRSAPTYLYRIKSHGGAPFNTRADTLAEHGVHDIHWHVPRTNEDRICYEVPGYSGVWCTRVQRYVDAQMARHLTTVLTVGQSERASLPTSYYDPPAGWGSTSWASGGEKASGSRIQTCNVPQHPDSQSDTYPTPANLKLWGIRTSGA